MFVGYPPTNKGYRLIQLTGNSFLTLRNFTFEGNIFSFHQSFTSQYMKPLPIGFPLSNSSNADPDLFNFLEDIPISSD